MRITLVGADFEENLALGMIAAALEGAGHEVAIEPFNEPEQAAALAARIVAAAPDLVGLSIQFQHRAREFLDLARRMRALGGRAHVTAGGHFPTLAFREVLATSSGVDSVVLHEGEATVVELCAALAAARPLEMVPGLALRDGCGGALRTRGRPLARLDELPFPRRYRRHARHMGVPFVPILGSRGCWGACTYCSITSFYRDARTHGGGHTLRLRSPESVAAEMALLWHRAGPSVFCFHDDNFLLPRPTDTLARLAAIRAELDRLGVGRVGFIGKCRPDCVTPALARSLADLGVVRLYVGVENAAEAGAAHLGRRTQAVAVDGALRACREAGIFVCYNLLLFEPDATLDDVAANIAFIRAHASHPVNFCRAEPYYGTPLHLGLAARGELGGSWLGWNYTIADRRTELLFRIAAAAFRQRNFDPDGVGNRSMGLGYSVKLLERFHDEIDGRRARLGARAAQLTRDIALETAEFLDQALEFVRSVELSDADRVARETALLGLRIAAADRARHAELDTLYGDLDAFATAATRPFRALRPPRAMVQLARRLATGAALGAATVSGPGCGPTGVDPVPGPVDLAHPVVDPVPPDLGADLAEMQVVDPPPPDQAVSPDSAGPDQSSIEMQVVDPAPPDAATPRDGAPDGGSDGGRELGLQGSLDPRRRRLPVLDPRPDDREPARAIDQWRDSSPRLALRSPDLPLHTPPALTLRLIPDGALLRVHLTGGPAGLSVRWEGDHVAPASDDPGEREAQWAPVGPDDQIRVAARSHGGVAVLALRGRQAARRTRS